MESSMRREAESSQFLEAQRVDHHLSKGYMPSRRLRGEEAETEQLLKEVLNQESEREH